MKRLNGLTLIETMVAISLLSLMVLGTINYFTQRAEIMRSKQLGNDMALIMNAIDKKLQLDAYSDKSWKSSSWTNTTDFMQKLIGEELRTSNSTCGKPNGWVSDLAPDPLALVPCDRLSGSFLPNGVQVSANYTTEAAADGGRNISLFTIDYYFKDIASFKKNFSTLVKAHKALDKFENAKNLTVHSYNYFNVSSKAPMTLTQCLISNQGCGLRTQIESFTGLSTDKVRIDGKNDLMGEIDFDNADTKCTQWDYAGGLWKSTEIKCTVQGGFDSKVGSVDAYINNTTISDRISLKDQCSLTSSISENKQDPYDSSKTITETWLADDNLKKIIVPCGLTKEGLLITSGFAKTNAKITVTDNAITRSAKLGNPVVKYDANLYGGLTTKDLSIQKSLDSKNINIATKLFSVITDIRTSVTGSLSKATTQVLITNNVKTTNALLNKVNSDLLETTGVSTTTVGGDTLVDTRDPKYNSTNGATYQRRSSIANGSVIAKDFYSGYSTLPTENNLADQSWNTLSINNITGSSPVSIIGSTKDEATIKNEMLNPNASALDVAIYKDAKTFYSDPNATLTASKLASASEFFTSETPPSAVDESDASIYADARYSDEQTVVKGKIEVYHNTSALPRVSVSNDGVMTIRGKHLGNGHTTADFMVGWPAPAEGAIGENGFRNKVFRNSLVTIVKGETRFYGNVWQWKPLHMNSTWTESNVCDRPGGIVTTCLTWGWNDLNTIQSILQNVKAQYDLVQSKFPIKIGDKGDIGEKGFKGEKGQDGDSGPIGNKGPRGPMEYLKVTK